ncbi:MAG: hypothetical protein Q4E13_11070 [Clostridia bacterium]|nr:hypothetical protein [Clostridia bacterium]
MKKLLSVLLCLMLCVSAAAMAESADVQSITSVSGLFTYDLPSDYLVITADTAETIINAYGADMLAEAGMDASILESMDYANTDYAYTSDFSGNLNVQITAESGLSQSMLESLASMLDKSLTDTYVQFGVAEEDCEPRGVEQIGENIFYMFHVNMLGSTMDQFITFNEAQTMFTITCTNMDEAAERAILESFKLIEE